MTVNNKWASQLALVIKKPPANAGDVRDAGLIPGLGRSPGGGHGSPLQYSCLGNSMGRGAQWATVHRITKSQTRLKQLSTHATNKYFGLSKMLLNTNRHFYNRSQTLTGLGSVGQPLWQDVPGEKDEAPIMPRFKPWHSWTKFLILSSSVSK